MQGIDSIKRTATYPWRRWPRLVKAVLAGAVAVVLLIAGSNAYILLSAEGDSTGVLADVAPAQVAIVPGALVEPDGDMSAMLADRVHQAAALWHAGRVEKVLVSGDHGQWVYDE